MNNYRKTLRMVLSYLLVLCLVLADFSGIAETGDTLTMPPALQIIGEKAFYGSTSIDKVGLPENIKEIRALAFANSTLSEINLPDALTYVDETAFDGPDKVTVTANKGTYAYDWAVEHLYIIEGPLPESIHPYVDF